VPRTAQDVGRGFDYRQVYLDALAIDSEAPGTVCTAEVHYVRDHRHTMPYRVGYCHNMQQPNEHWHANEDQAHACPDRQMRKYEDD
jgi:hypothetical protein